MYRKSRILKLKKWWLHNPWLGPLLVFCVALVMFAVWTAAPTFRDPDTFYHIKVTEIMIEKQRAIAEFPWLQFTTLKDAYADHHLLYHVYLVPFIILLKPVIGVKLATALLAALTILLFQLLLVSQKVRYAAFFSLLLLFTHGFAFRMALAKAPAVGFLFLVGGFYLIANRKYRLLIPLSFCFVWAYGGFLLLPIVGAIFTAATLIVHWATHTRFPDRTHIMEAFKPLGATLIGIAGGLLIHPSFPHHINFYWQQIIQIGLINYQEQIGVGGEWYPYPAIDLVTSPLVVTGLLVAAIIAFIITAKKQNAFTVTALVMAVIFFIFTLKSHRYIEYYIPWAILASALILQAGGVLHAIPGLCRRARRAVRHSAVRIAAAGVAGLFLVFITCGVVVVNAQSTYNSHHSGITVDDFARAGKWLRNHSNEKDVIFHSNWDIFPQMFFQVPRVYYIVGLDPTFMYNYNKDLYWKWVNITTGKQTDRLLETIQVEFNARFVVVENDHHAMMNNIRADGRFIEAYSDDDYTIFRVPRPEQLITEP